MTQNIHRLLDIAGVPDSMQDAAIVSIITADGRSDGLLRHKFNVRYRRAKELAAMMEWETERLVDIDPTLIDEDVAPMTMITAYGDNNPYWYDTPAGGRPVERIWLNPDPNSAEYKEAVSLCYWCPGYHPRSHESRLAWIKRNGGEGYAWRRGEPINASDGVEIWRGKKGLTKVVVHRCGSAWQIQSTTRAPLLFVISTRIGYEVDNVFCGNLSPRMWFPIPGYDLRAPVTWSRMPQWKGLGLGHKGWEGPLKDGEKFKRHSLTLPAPGTWGE